MSPVEIAAFFVPFLTAAVAATWLSARVRATWWLVVPAAASTGLYLLLLFATPFAGVVTELPLFVATCLALVPGHLMFATFARRAGRRGSPRDVPLPLPFVLLVLVAAVIMPWTVRVSYARRVALACDGPVVARYRSDNHRAPTLVVRSAAGEVKLEGVDAPLFEAAREGDLLAKPRASAFGTLGRRPVRVIPRTMGWWHEPGAP